jgi:hypothetical protein
MGRWGGNIVTRGRWDPEGFAAQTLQFVTGVQNGMVLFGYDVGQRTADMSSCRLGQMADLTSLR